MAPLTETVSRFLSAGSVVSVPAVMLVGFLSTLKNPCAIPLYPAATSACVAGTISIDRVNQVDQVDGSGPTRLSFLNASAFVIGMAIAIAILGLGAVAAGRVIGIGQWGRYLIALLPVLMGMQRLGWIKLSFFKFSLNRTFRPGLAGAFATGLLLSLVIARCGGTVLGALLAYAAYHQAFVYGGVLLFAYGVGAGIPLIAFGTVVGKLTQWIDTRGYRKWTEYAMGGMMLILGFYLLWLA
ncbi:MAG TPA: cytochrome c biogenesis protein CcdA [Candidatus Angelobacter sp.]|nr:cytochrome c biogenesis protein CcdA [Candidatus Angelobacter sp.]